jgi:hypothetical protein
MLVPIHFPSTQSAFSKGSGKEQGIKLDEEVLGIGGEVIVCEGDGEGVGGGGVEGGSVGGGKVGGGADVRVVCGGRVVVTATSSEILIGEDLSVPGAYPPIAKIE